MNVCPIPKSLRRRSSRGREEIRESPNIKGNKISGVNDHLESGVKDRGVKAGLHIFNPPLKGKRWGLGIKRKKRKQKSKKNLSRESRGIKGSSKTEEGKSGGSDNKERKSKVHNIHRERFRFFGGGGGRGDGLDEEATGKEEGEEDIRDVEEVGPFQFVAGKVVREKGGKKRKEIEYPNFPTTFPGRKTTKLFMMEPTQMKPIP